MRSGATPPLPALEGQPEPRGRVTRCPRMLRGGKSALLACAAVVATNAALKDMTMVVAQHRCMNVFIWGTSTVRERVRPWSPRDSRER